MREKRFCESKFRSMLLTGTFTMAVIYIMLLCDNIIAGYFIGEAGVAAINAVTPVTGIVTFSRGPARCRPSREKRPDPGNSGRTRA